MPQFGLSQRLPQWSASIVQNWRDFRSRVSNLRGSSEDERISFVKYGRFENESDMGSFAETPTSERTELAEGSIENVPKESSDDINSISPNAVSGFTPMSISQCSELKESAKGLPNRKNEKISEWQAGWNVTNAIQVRKYQ